MNCLRRFPVKIICHARYKDDHYVKMQVACSWFWSSYCYRRTRKRNVVKSVISNGRVKILQTKAAGDVIRKLNWENQLLFGNLSRFVTVNRPKTSVDKLQPELCDDYMKHVPLIAEPRDVYSFVERHKLSENYFFTILQDAMKDGLQSGPLPLENNLPSPFSEFDSAKLLDFPISNSWRESAPDLEVNPDLEMDFDSEQTGEIQCPSVTRILQATMPEESAQLLKRWKEKMIASMGKEKFEEYQQRLFSQGAAFHGCVEKYLKESDEEMEIPHQVAGFWESGREILPHVNNVHYIEGPVQHPFLHYKGIFDCIADYRGIPSLIEWKTSRKYKPTVKELYDGPLQVVAYIGAVNFDKRYDVQINQGVIVVVYEDGHPGHVCVLSRHRIMLLWKQWLHRLSLYWKIAGKQGN